MWKIVLLVFLASSFAFGRTQKLQTARDYYKELYAAGGLDGRAGEYACFQDDSNSENFFIFAISKHMRKYLIGTGRFAKLPKEAQGFWKKDFLLVRGYAKGVPFSENEILSKDADSWESEEHMLDKSTSIRIRFTINGACQRL